MSTLTQTDGFVSVTRSAPGHVYDEAYDREGKPRAAWGKFLESLKQVSNSELTHRSEQAELQLLENGVTFNVFQEGEQLQRPWRLDLLPVIVGADEWSSVTDGLRQRARLLDLVVRDCYHERRMIREGVLPPEVLFANPGFIRAFVGLNSQGPAITSYAAELARGANGEWRVMADRAEAPAGAAFALENRIVASRTLPGVLHDKHVERLAPFFLEVQNSLKRLAGRQTENPRIVLLSPGAAYPYYFEDVYLARYLGYTLVEGADLAVRDDRVFLKTLAGLLPIDVIVSRGVERWLDPLELGGSEPHGVPGLLRVIREGKVKVANRPGSGLIESPIFMAFLPQLCRQLLGEEMLLSSIPTWWCGDGEHFDYVKEHLKELVIKPAFQASGNDEIIGMRLGAAGKQELLERIASAPHQYVAQELIARSAVPVYHDGRVKTGHMAVRTFAVATENDYSVMPGGLVRVAATADPMVLSISAGEGSKDLWVLAKEEVQPVSLLAAEGTPVPLRRTSAVFPSRVADDLFWFGQSLDRADFLCRLLRAVIDRLSTESANEVTELPSLIRALADQGQIEPAFAIDAFSPQMPNFTDELPRMISNPDETRGLVAAISELHRLASLERLWMSPDTFRQVRATAAVFLSSAENGWTSIVDVSEAVNHLILELAAISGLVHDGMVRGPAWRVLDFGRRVERARDTISLLKSTFSEQQNIARPVLKALLEVIDCRMTYRSRYLDNLQQNAVLDLCITDETCPRSIAFQIAMLVEHVDALPSETASLLRSEEKRAVMAASHLVRMISAEQLEERPAEEVANTLVNLDVHLKSLSEIVTRKYLLHSGVPRQITSELELTQ